jgi:hypothetical protein
MKVYEICVCRNIISRINTPVTFYGISVFNSVDNKYVSFECSSFYSRFKYFDCIYYDGLIDSKQGRVVFKYIFPIFRFTLFIKVMLRFEYLFFHLNASIILNSINRLKIMEPIRRRRRRVELNRNNHKWTLIPVVCRASNEPNWRIARTKWIVSDRVQKDNRRRTTCICTHHGLRWLYTIRHITTGRELFPIGSRCILHF